MTPGRRAASWSLIRRVASTPIVPICAHTHPSANASATWPSKMTDSTASAVGSIVITTLASRTASGADAATTTPASASGPVADAARSHTRVVRPAAARLRAIADPMIPAPITATATPPFPPFALAITAPFLPRPSFCRPPAASRDQAIGSSMAARTAQRIAASRDPAGTGSRERRPPALSHEVLVLPDGVDGVEVAVEAADAVGGAAAAGPLPHQRVGAGAGLAAEELRAGPGAVIQAPAVRGGAGVVRGLRLVGPLVGVRDQRVGAGAEDRRPDPGRGVHADQTREDPPRMFDHCLITPTRVRLYRALISLASGLVSCHHLVRTIRR